MNFFKKLTLCLLTLFSVQISSALFSMDEEMDWSSSSAEIAVDFNSEQGKNLVFQEVQHYAAATENDLIPFVINALRQGFPINLRNNENKTLLQVALEKDLFDTVILLLLQQDIDTNSLNFETVSRFISKLISRLLDETLIVPCTNLEETYILPTFSINPGALYPYKIISKFIPTNDPTAPSLYMRQVSFALNLASYVSIAADKALQSSNLVVQLNGFDLYRELVKKGYESYYKRAAIYADWALKGIYGNYQALKRHGLMISQALAKKGYINQALQRHALIRTLPIYLKH